MKAALIHSYGTPDVFQIEDIPRPTPGPREILVAVHAASINPIDYKIRQGGQRALIHYSFPRILGLDVSGVVEAIGEKVTRFQVGDAIYSSPPHTRQGTYAEYTVLHENEAAHKPAGLTHEEAASIPLVGLTVWESFVCKGQLKKGDRILIQAGSGGVGTFAIQLAKQLGAHVITTCSERNFELVRSLGADEVINYREQDFATVCQDLDFVLDSIGGETVKKSYDILKKGGHLSVLNSGLPGYTERYGWFGGLLAVVWNLLGMKMRALSTGVQHSMILRQPKGDLLAQLTPYLEEKTIRPVIDRTFALDDIAEAHRYSESGRARGKIVISVRPS
ncbi:MAG TPA: NADPH:quinone reductase [Myxococcales bacterium]|nr:NADPH:quinone reductase [Deltaproteobacteria bacterium]MBU47852.1 NADPH:quinone reductase [Deltaproteobacteria bacterium]HAA54110.1 NADPH:quinone reductase [Myxococcales bacterium]|tara:strand:- start:9359 stop:10360 length:1002 start_codon:yes stop_codon:yes gene_type:complete